MSETVDFILPDLGEGVHEAEIISWKVKAGDRVEEMDVLAEMETDKALVEVPSPFAGEIVGLHGEEGQIAHVGKPIVTFRDATQSGKPVSGNGTGGGAGAAAAEPAEPETTPAEAAASASGSPGGTDEGEQREDAGTVVGSVGGGTGLPTARACLNILGLAGPGHANALAEVCAGLVLAGELSITAALTAHEFTEAHRRLARDRQPDPSTPHATGDGS